jgi:hypothetical protein
MSGSNSTTTNFTPPYIPPMPSTSAPPTAFGGASSFVWPSGETASEVLNYASSESSLGLLNVDNSLQDSPVSGDFNEFVVQPPAGGGSVSDSLPGGFSLIYDTAAGATITSSDTLAPDTVVGSTGGMTLWDHSTDETAFTSGGDNIIGMRANHPENLTAQLGGQYNEVALGYGSASLAGGGAQNLIWGSGNNTGSTLDVTLDSGASTVVSGVGTNTVNVAGAGDVVFAGLGNGNTTISGNNAVYVGGSGSDTVSLGAGATAWGESGPTYINETGNATVVGGSGSMSVYDQAADGAFFNLGSGVMTVNGVMSTQSYTDPEKQVINDNWNGSGGMDITADAGATVNTYQGQTTVNSAQGGDNINFIWHAGGVINSYGNDNINISSNGTVEVNEAGSFDTVSAAQGSGNVTMNFVFGSAMYGGSGTNTFIPTEMRTEVPNADIFDGSGTNYLVLNAQNTSGSTENTIDWSYSNPSHDYVELNGIGSQSLVDSIVNNVNAEIANYNHMLESPGNELMTTPPGFTIGSIKVILGGETVAPMSYISSSHFILS